MDGTQFLAEQRVLGGGEEGEVLIVAHGVAVHVRREGGAGRRTGGGGDLPNFTVGGRVALLDDAHLAVEIFADERGGWSSLPGSQSARGILSGRPPGLESPSVAKSLRILYLEPSGIGRFLEVHGQSGR